MTRDDRLTAGFGILLPGCIVLACVLGIQAQEVSDHQLTAVIERIREHPSDVAALEEARLMGFQLLREACYEKAVTLFTTITEVNHEDVQSLYGSALALFNLGRIDEARRPAQLAVSISRLRAQVGKEQSNSLADELVLLAVILAVKNENASALTAVKEAVAIAPDNFDAQFALGRALYGAGDPADAVAAFRKAIALRGNDAKSRFFLATALEAAGDYDQARAAYSELVALYPENGDGHLGLGVLLVKLGGGRTEEGITELSKAVTLNGNLYEARLTLGRALIKVGRPQEAIEHLVRAVELAPNNPEPHYQLAIAYRRMGKSQQAEQESLRVRQINSERRGNGSSAKTPANN